MEPRRNGNPNPRVTANFISIVFFWWLSKFFRLGYRKDLEVGDLYQILDEDNSQRLGLKLQSEWNKELTKANSEEGRRKKLQPSLVKALWRVFGFRFAVYGFFALIEECFLRIASPLCLGQFVLYFVEDGDMPEWQAYCYATALVVCTFATILTYHPCYFGLQHTGMKMRIACCSLIYSKCLKLSQKSLGQTTVGQMVNLMSNDVNRFDMGCVYTNYLWVGPVQMIISLGILCSVIGVSALAGFGVLVLFIIFQGSVGRVFSRLRLKTALKTDERIRKMNEIISGMRVIKMYTWEKPFAKIVDMFRRKEIAVVREASYLRSLNMSLFFASSKLVVFLTFIVYVLTGNALTAEKVFLTLALHNNIRLAMTLFFPNAISSTAEMKVSVNRIQKFLLLDEKKINEQPIARPPLNQCGIWMNRVTAKWPLSDEADQDTLKDISFTVKPGEVLAIVGSVGSGKSSLLQVILGELFPKSGSIRVAGKIAYASQEAWVFSGTIRHNILCGQEYDARKYKKIVKVCALDKDLKLLPEGDRTPVGDKGVSLSGGQKARVNLARALYCDADVYLLDDPLSAVDTHVGKHLFNECVMGYLRNKVRILVTHQLQYLRDVNNILILNEGQIEAIGTYHQLMNSRMDFAKMMTEDKTDEEEDHETFIRTQSLNQLNSSFKRNESISGSLSRIRRSSTLSRASVRTVEAEETPVFIEELRTTGKVSWKVYGQYLNSGGVGLTVLIAVLMLIGQALFTFSDYWLSLWTDMEELRAHTQAKGQGNVEIFINNSAASPEDQYVISSSIIPDLLINDSMVNHMEQTNETASNSTDTFVWWRDLDTVTSIYVYTGIICCLFVFAFIRTLTYFVMCMRSSVNLHNKMFQSVIRTSIVFFDTNPVGRTLNRFAKDIGCMDELMPGIFFEVLSVSLTLIGSLILVGVVNGWLLLPVVFLLILFLFLRMIYLETSRDVKRLEATTRSPVFSHLSSTYMGLITVRAHKLETTFQSYFDQYQDTHSSAWYMFISTSRCLGVWLDLICIVYVMCVAYSCLPLRDSLTSSGAGLVVSSAMALTGYFQWMVRQSAELENQMTSVERIIEYSRLPEEPPLTSPPDKRPPPSWPQFGKIQFDNVCVVYNEKDDPVLKNITCVVNPKEKVGIVGRTGAGKSSLITTLFRLTEPTGYIYIDGIDTKNIGLHELRSKISIIPQDPVLFTGTLRMNLDPFNEFSDDALWKALEDVRLKESVAELAAGLDSIMAESGSNFSVGQRQLVCLARAILRKNKILVMDEATANVDPTTDTFIQETIREKFAECTVLTVAHRLNTIIDSDRVMVLDAGSLKEFEEPSVLLENPDSLFCGLVEQTGKNNVEILKEMARQAAHNRRAKRANSTSAETISCSGSLHISNRNSDEEISVRL